MTIVSLNCNPSFIRYNKKLAESCINAVISTSSRGEISTNKQTSPIVVVTATRIYKFAGRLALSVTKEIKVE